MLRAHDRPLAFRDARDAQRPLVRSDLPAGDLNRELETNAPSIRSRRPASIAGRRCEHDHALHHYRRARICASEIAARVCSQDATRDGGTAAGCVCNVSSKSGMKLLVASPQPGEPHDAGKGLEVGAQYPIMLLG